MEKLGPLTSLRTQTAIVEAYDVSYQIFNYEEERGEGPLAHIAFREQEDYTTNSPLYSRIAEFMKLRIGRHMSMTEYLNLPRDIVEEVNRLALEGQGTEASLADELKDELEGK